MSKKQLIIYLVAAIAAIGGTLAFRLWPRTVPPEEASELYRRYADTPGVDATFIKGFHVNDTLSLDVTLLQATDSMGWETLVTDFQLPTIFLTSENHNVIFRKAKKGHTDRQRDPISENNDQIIVAVDIHAISIFHITDKNQFYQLILKQAKDLKNNP